MAYERIARPDGCLYHYTTRGHLDSILRDGRIRRMGDTECWFCTSLENTLAVMARTVMQEGKPYFGIGGVLKRYPAFVPEDYVILKLEPRYQNGDWVRDDDVFYEFGWNDDYDDISEEEAKAIMKAMDHVE